MYAVERLGSYITRGVYTVSGPFHPFGGAVDIIVVEQPDGSFKSSPWYVRFGKFQGVLKAREKVVTISVNGIETNFDMILDPRGEAYFLRELEGEEGDSLSYSSSSGDEMDEQSQKSSRPMKSKSCDYDVSKSSGDQLDASNGKIVARNNSRRSRISGLIFGRRSVEGDGHLKAGDGTDIARISSLERAEIAADLVETFMLDGNGLEEKLVEISEISTNVDEASIQVAHQDDGTKVTCSDSQIKDTFERCPGKNLDEKETSDEMDVVLPGCSASEEENRSHRVESSLICETSKRLYIASGGSEEVHLCAQTFHATAEPVVEDTVNKQAENIGLKRRYIESHDIYPQQTFPSSSSLNGHDEANIEVPVTISPFTEMICVNPALDSVEIEPKAISSMSSSSNSVDQIQDEVNIGNEITRDDSEQLNGDCGLTKTSRSPESESSEEEQFFFSDIDDFEPREAQGESDFPDADDNNNHPSSCAEGTSIIIEPVHMNDESYSPSHKCVQKNGLSDFGNVTENPKLISSPIRIPKHQSVASAEVERLVESLPNLWSNFDNLDEDDLSCSLSHSLDLNSKSLEWNMQQKNEPQSTNADTGNDTPLQAYSKDGDTLHSEDNKDGISNPAVGDPSETIVTTGGSWRLWPFPFRRSRSRKTTPALNDTRSSDAENVSESNAGVDNSRKVLDGRVSKKMIKAVTPTSEQLASLNLREGSNEVTFTFSTSVLGRQKVDARIFLWKWNTRIVISDVDGTITKSDVLGQFMPLVGIDWSQTGVAHLFSAIKDNGYQFLYLSARAIAQAYITRQFLVNFKQDGKALPDGPVVISPDGLFPSLFREVIRRAPHEFKIACLEDIRALFPSDCNPFYAGFGNRDTDEISYLKVGIPKGKIFIINPKGEVAVNRLVDTRSYTSLHALVHGMFPAMTSSEQEDYNSWNFWKLPPPDINM
ncbi:phosphatidate phosphatase PAH2 isoform X2 [Ricinus communis]|uniref:phosphatidate phosphatase PAH2 isoform X2 n=1 Tax=Ricinus communis TaxID=3988 RepID=UPI0007728AD8|nr:phosphatidate phosphatase PAH2 isoform X2 [Ricinus communis]|eukprot:XP_015575335.1 phosphatidate phosphatase PAH2 isoform X2 [Ricinus communis]